MADPGPVTARLRLAALSVRITEDQGYWLDCRARRLGRSTGEALRAILDEVMGRDVHHGTQRDEKASRSATLRGSR